MFGKRKPSDPTKRSAILADLEHSSPATPAESDLGPTEIPVAPSRVPTARAPVEAPRRSVDARVPARPAPAKAIPAHATTEQPAMVQPTPDPSPLANPQPQSRTLVVGQGIRLSGEITTCDKLVVEGRVEADLADSQDLVIAESGLYKGSASVQRAEISGHFAGALTVHERLLIRASGRVSGTLTYADLEVERGGKITGKIVLLGEQVAAPEPAAPQPAEAAPEQTPDPEQTPAFELTPASERPPAPKRSTPRANPAAAPAEPPAAKLTNGGGDPAATTE
jgi:cytoskeletal protein CcmA (bactofilin family)